MNYPWTIFIATLFLLSTQATADTETISQQIAAKVSLVSDLLMDGYASEHSVTRGITVLEDDAGNALAAAAVFTLEGFAQGNNYTQYLAFFARLSSPEKGNNAELSLLDVVAVGGKHLRRVDSSSIQLKREDGIIVITASEQNDGCADPSCSQSSDSELKFTIQPSIGGRLTELNNKP